MSKSKNEQMMFDKYNELKTKNENLQIQFTQLVMNENKIRIEQENLNELLADMNKKISVYTDNIDSILKDDSENNVLSNENLKIKCLDKFNLFFSNREESNEESIYEFQIEYSNTVFRRRIEKDSMTFSDLKKEMKYHIGRSEDQFFFCDANKSIFLDDFKIIDVLFPFGKIILNHNIPVIKIIESNCDIEILIDVEKIDNEKIILEDQKNIQDSTNNFFNFFIKRIISSSIYSIIFLIFLFFWACTVKDFRDVSNYFLMNYTFVYKKLLTIKYSNGFILEDLKKTYADLFGFPPQNSSFIYYEKKLNREELF